MYNKLNQSSLVKKKKKRKQEKVELEQFDPNVHEALMIHEVNDPAMKDVVIEVFASGYRIGDTVLRPAKVIVGSYTAPPEPEVVEAEEVSQEQPEEDAE